MNCESNAEKKEREEIPADASVGVEISPFLCYDKGDLEKTDRIGAYFGLWDGGERMDQYKQEFIEFMLDCKVLKFGDFTLKSGRRSPFFMNAGGYVTGSQLMKLGEYYAFLRCTQHSWRLRAA